MKEKEINELMMNPFTKIGKQWCLIGAKHNGKFNAMTASWGGVGVLWNKNVVTIYVRPQRYTRELIENSDYFTLSFLGEEYRKQLKYYGTHSGREENKEEVSGLHQEEDGNYAYLREAELVLECKKLYCGNIEKEGILDKSIDTIHYPQKDYHYIYIGEITKVLEG